MKRLLLFAGGLALILALPLSGQPEFGLGPAFTHITLEFVSGETPQPGVNVILVDESNREQTGVSDNRGRVKFTIQAESGEIYLTYWKSENLVFKKSLSYAAGNNYNFCLKVEE